MPWTGSLTSLSLSLMMRLGKPDMSVGCQGRLRLEELGDTGMSLVEVVLVDASLFAGVCGDFVVFAAILVETQARMS
jgi:hypothetical protein